MFHTNVFKTENHPDLEIAARKRYAQRINQLENNLSKTCTPEQLEKAESIAEKFRESLVFKYISAENSIVNAVVWKSHNMSHSVGISFLLNGKEITVNIPDAERIIRAGRHSGNWLGDIKDAICNAVAKELTAHVYVEVIESTLQSTKENK